MMESGAAFMDGIFSGAGVWPKNEESLWLVNTKSAKKTKHDMEAFSLRPTCLAGLQMIGQRSARLLVFGKFLDLGFAE
jgi:hypothetical protein